MEPGARTQEPMQEKSLENSRHPLASTGVAVVGSTTLDEVRIADRRVFKMGGVTAYAGLTYAHFKIPVRVVTRVGKKEAWMIQNLRREGISPCVEFGGATTVFVNVLEGEKRLQKMLSAADAISKDQLLHAVTGIDTIHLGPLHPRDIDPAALCALGPHGHFIVLDIQGYVRRRKKDWIRPGVSGNLPIALGLAKILKADREEMALALDFFKCSLRRLLSDFHIDEAVVTEGHRGGFIQEQGGGPYPFDPIPVAHPSDSTGAGDVFFAAYVACRRFGKAEVPAAARTASRIAANQVAGAHIREKALCP